MSSFASERIGLDLYFFVAKKRHFQKRPANTFNKPNFSKQSLSLWFQYPELLREDPRESDVCSTSRGGGWGAGPTTRCSAFCHSHISVSKRHKLVLTRTRSSQMNVTALGLDRKDGHPSSNAFFRRAPSLLLRLCKKIRKFRVYCSHWGGR